MNHLPLNSMKPRQFNRKNNTIDMKLSKKKKKKIELLDFIVALFSWVTVLPMIS